VVPLQGAAVGRCVRFGAGCFRVLLLEAVCSLELACWCRYWVPLHMLFQGAAVRGLCVRLRSLSAATQLSECGVRCEAWVVVPLRRVEMSMAMAVWALGPDGDY